jgi:hypothetical protein
MTTSTTTKRSFQGWQNVMTFISDMRNQAEEGNANNEEELFKIAVATYDLQTEGELNYARNLIEMNVHFDTFEEDFGYTIKEYIKRGEGYFSAKNLGDLTYEDLLAACRQYIETLEEDLIEEYGVDHHEDILDEDLDFNQLVLIAKTNAIYEKHTDAKGMLDFRAAAKDCEADTLLAANRGYSISR